MNYSNPRTSFETDNWPYGSKRVNAYFYIEQGKKGERAVRVTENPKGGENKPKKLTFAHEVRIVDGDDGKTYIAELSDYGFITIMQSNMQYQQETIHPRDPRFIDAISLFNVSKTNA